MRGEQRQRSLARTQFAKLEERFGVAARVGVRERCKARRQRAGAARGHRPARVGHEKDGATLRIRDQQADLPFTVARKRHRDGAGVAEQIEPDAQTAPSTPADRRPETPPRRSLARQSRPEGAREEIRARYRATHFRRATTLAYRCRERRTARSGNREDRQYGRHDSARRSRFQYRAVRSRSARIATPVLLLAKA